ncbi:MAG: sulfur carrier protein ThiS adenylyltransferase ThiF [Candidatus Edwardsbacteria bacterium]|nr:sulfur carrier protein ThiS adenylyltransferase ThiF [Candidatus Edwardsbacteria bacterium]
MKIFVNEKKISIAKGAKVADLVKKHKPGADVCILNGFPCLMEHTVEAGDRLVLIRKGETPSKKELEHLLTARHTPGIHARLKKASVGIAGCGGLGSTAAMALARVGIGKLVIVDFDVVEPSNLNRQQYFVSQIGTPKVAALAENIKKANPYVAVVTHRVRIVPENVKPLFLGVNVIIEAFDRADQKQMLVESVLRRMPKKPLIVGNGMAGYGANELFKTRRIGHLYVCGDETSEAGHGFGLMAPRVGVCAHMQANLALEIILGPDPRITNDPSIRRGGTSTSSVYQLGTCELRMTKRNKMKVDSKYFVAPDTKIMNDEC